MAATPRPLFDPQIVRRAIGDSFVKLAPRHMVRNPVMFVVLIGSVLTTLVLIRDAAGDIIGAVGISGDTSDKDEACAVAGIAAAGLKADTGAPT